MNALAKLALPLALTFVPIVLPAQSLTAKPKWNNDDTQRIAQQVQKELLSLTQYSVFDSLSWGLRGNTITLGGFASRPTLKSAAENVVKKIEGVTSVDNKIVVLPLSPMDDQLRSALYANIYGQPQLRKYTSNYWNAASTPSIARSAGGITVDPPLGYHAIHIIVKNGHVTLTGVVNNRGDAIVAQMQANSTSGVFSVDNDLRFPESEEKK